MADISISKELQALLKSSQVYMSSQREIAPNHAVSQFHATILLPCDLRIAAGSPLHRDMQQMEDQLKASGFTVDGRSSGGNTYRLDITGGPGGVFPQSDRDAAGIIRQLTGKTETEAPLHPNLREDQVPERLGGCMAVSEASPASGPAQRGSRSVG